MPDGDEVVFADEDAGLAQRHVPILQCCRAQHHEQ